MEADTDRDGKISFEEFTKMVENTDVSNSMTLGTTFPCIFIIVSFVTAPSTVYYVIWQVANKPPHRSILIDTPLINLFHSQGRIFACKSQLAFGRRRNAS